MGGTGEEKGPAVAQWSNNLWSVLTAFNGQLTTGN